MGSNLLDVLQLEIELHAEKFLKGQKELQDGFDKLAKNLIQGGKNIEDQHRKTADSIGAVSRELQGMFGLIKGGLAAEAFKTLTDFANGLANISANLGRFSANVGIQPQVMQSWGMVLQQYGGKAEDAYSAFQSFSKMQNDYRWGGGIPDGYMRLFTDAGMMGVAGPSMGMSSEQQGLAVARAILETRRLKGRKIAYEDATTQAHIPEGFVKTVLEFKDIGAFQAALAGAQKNATSQKAIEEGKDFQKNWNHLIQALEKLSTILFTAIEPPLSRLVTWLTKIAERLGMAPPEGKRLDPDQNVLSAPVNGPRWVGDPYYKGGGWLRRYLKKNVGASSGSDEAPSQSSAVGASSGSDEAPSQSSVIQATINEWRAAGMPDEGIAGVLRNVKDESHFDPTDRSPWEDQVDPAFRGKESAHAHGLFQLGGGKWDDYEGWINKNYPGANWKDPALQNRFAIDWIKTHNPSLWNSMATGNRHNAALQFLHGFEVPGSIYMAFRDTTYRRDVPEVGAYLPKAGAGLSAQGYDLPKAGAGLSAQGYAPSWSTTTNSSDTTIHSINVQANDPGEFTTALHDYLKRRRSVGIANGLH